MLKILKEKRMINPNEEFLEFVSLRSDKLKVKNLVSNICPYLKVAKVFGIYDRFEQIDISKMPAKFVIKTNHWSGDVKVIHSHSEFNKKYKTLKKHFNEILKKKYLSGNSKHYALILPKLFIEEFINDNIKEVKIHCIWGVPVFLHYQEIQNNIQNCYDVNWNLLNFTKKNTIVNEKHINRPQNLFEIFQITTDLCKDIDYVRLDLYLSDKSEFVFGEYTFTPMDLNKYYTNHLIYDVMTKMYTTKNINLKDFDKFIKY
jgi:hypothetical protein